MWMCLLGSTRHWLHYWGHLNLKNLSLNLPLVYFWESADLLKKRLGQEVRTTGKEVRTQGDLNLPAKEVRQQGRRLGQQGRRLGQHDRRLGHKVILTSP